jgi:2-oxoglutarate dehydrogenase E2 component (dihydrolipoamide succinyltransferase)
MPIDVVMPQMGESIFEGTITKWLKRAGDPVRKGEPLFEISSNNVDAKIPSPATGVLSEIKVPVGATVQIRTEVAVIDSVASVSASAAIAVPINDSRGLGSSPNVRRIAEDSSRNLGQILDIGSGDRITKEDVPLHLSQHGPDSAEPDSAAELAAPQAPDELVPLTKMRAIIAHRMVESLQISPHVHTCFKVDMTRIVQLREHEKVNFEQRNGVKLTYMPFIAAAAVEALRKFPIVNASMENGFIRYRRNINLGIAVAVPWGLIVPVVKHAERLGFLGLARAIADLGERARSKKLMPDEVSGSTFTLTNSGIFGDEFTTPIINQPDSAILAISGLKKEPVVLTDAKGNDSIVIRSMELFCLGFDHRTIDGADACKFMAEFKKVLEGWDKEVG